MEFITLRDTFYIASVSETGWPYVQHRGGPRGRIADLEAQLQEYRSGRAV
jgi:hypothetical protein